MKVIVRLLCLPLLLTGCSQVASSTDDGTSSGSESTTTAGEQPSETETGPAPSTSTTETFLPEDDQQLEPCDQFEQDCPEGEKCVPYSTTGGSWDLTKCVPILGDQGPGEPCVYGGIVDATDDCGAGSICWDVMEVDGELIGQCVLQCTGSPDLPTCPEGSSCLLSGSGVISICLLGCDPLLQDCDEGLACYWANDNFSCIPGDGQNIEPGEPCGFINDCAVGSMCVAGESLPACAGAACCTRFCELGGGDGPCAALPGTTCVAFFEEGFAPPGYEEVGVCVE